MKFIKKESNEKLYHYTSMKVVYNIIKNKELWLGNVLNTNDKSELTFFVNEIKGKLIENIPNKSDEIGNYFKNICSRIENETHYAFCFSTLRDDASLWERYADNAKGACIVVNTKKYRNIIERVGPLTLNEVFYGVEAEKHDHYKILEKYFKTEELSGGFQNIKGQQDNFITCSSVHKHNSFSQEKEIRSVTLLSAKYFNKEFSEIEFENKGSCIKEFLKIKYDQVCEKNNTTYSDLFDEIIIGPRSNQSDKILKDFCAENGFENIKITKSNCPLI